MDNQQNQYQNKYTELQLLGRGNYGSAYIVKSIQNGKLFVAKKMNLDGMTQGEIEAAKQQIEILKKFSDTNMYPFIVKYVESFYFQRTLVIVMEYCQYGDLATFIKHAKKKGEPIEEKVIMAWFVMLVMGIQALHSKNVLHRDLKSANIFLTSNKYVKIGDFGISKVLDSTSAKTFVGTPYYLSPEVCENKKYDLRSDLWSLGCILYELCTLNYPFQANNILSLAMKITSQEAAPIPNVYSKQLNTIVMGLLTKDVTKRKSLHQILQMPYMQKFMKQNVNKIDQICQTIPLKKAAKFQNLKGEGTVKQQRLTESGESTNQDTMKTIKSNFEKTSNNNTMKMTGNKSMKPNTLEYSTTGSMTPKDLAKMRKQQKIREEQQKLKQYARDRLADTDVRNFAKSKKQGDLGGSGSDFAHSLKDAKNLHIKYQNQNKQMAQQKLKRKNGLNDKQAINLQELNEACDLTRKMNGLTLNSTSNQNNNQPVDLTASMEKKIIAANQNFKAYTEPAVEEDIIDQQLQEYYDQEFQPYQNQQQKSNTEIQNDVLKSCLKVFSGQKEQVSPSKLAFVQKTFEKKEVLIKSSDQKKQECIKKCIALVKPQRYKLLYQMVSQGYKGDNYIESPELKMLRVKGSSSQKQALRLIQLIKYYETTPN